MAQKIIREYTYMGRKLGITAEYSFSGKKERVRIFEPEDSLSKFDIMELLEKMPLYDKIHMKSKVPALYRILQERGIDEKSYLSDEDLALYVLYRGFKNLTEIDRSEHKAMSIIRKRGLEKKLFSTDAMLKEFSDIK